MFKQVESYSEKELIEIFQSFKKIGDFFIYFGICDNGVNHKKLHKLCESIGFDLTIYKNKKKLFCQNCGKELTGYQQKFCSTSCSASYNNKKRGAMKDETKEKIKQSLKKWREEHKGDIIKDKKLKKTLKDSSKKLHFCQNCGKETKNKKFCCSKCSSDYVHMQAYKQFLEYPEKYCNGGYSPKSFKKDILEEQRYVCDICKCKPYHNGKRLQFVLDHIDGDASNNKRENLRMICPNCDSQLDTFKSKNKNSKRRNYWKDNIIKKLKNSEFGIGIRR